MDGSPDDAARVTRVPDEATAARVAQLAEAQLAEQAVAVVSSPLSRCVATAEAVAGRLRTAAVETEPLRESAHRLLVKVYLAEGNWGEALRQYRVFCSGLRDGLGLRPSTQMEELVRPLGDAAVTAP